MTPFLVGPYPRCVVVFALMTALGCSGGPAPSKPSRDEPLPQEVVPEPPETPASEATIFGAASASTSSLPFSLDVEGKGFGTLRRVAIKAGAGTITLGTHTLPAAITSRVPFAGDTLYELVAVEAGRWVIAWLYCDDGKLTTAFYETTLMSSLLTSPISGACVAREEETRIRIDFPAFGIPPPPPAASPRFTIEDADIHYDGTTPGSIARDGRSLAFYPFTVVDCTHCGGNWYELHAVIWDPEERSASFGVVYLDALSHGVTLAYRTALPSLRSLPSMAFPDARWHRAGASNADAGDR